ncbi:MMPL family transporter [Conchiformibius steedae]|uniref:MMPL family transporter n=1 Tax=Conchiformibius steedae TaxID=153493 RepID=A0A3P2A3M3_9NEIS|nr:hypothetical protein [Conchiformibius steedae]RRD90037.1 hypothetical protein EII21_06325 [Conchiformibius steedae]
MKTAAKLYALLCLVLLAVVCWRIPTQLQTDLHALIPVSEHDAVLQAAENARAKQLDGQVILALGANDAETAFAAAAQTAQQWQQSGLFAEVEAEIRPDLPALRQSAQQIGVAMLPAETAQQLQQQPQQYFQQRAEEALNPFAATLLPVEQDWLGFARFAAARRPDSAVQWHMENGMLFSEYAGKTWVWLRARVAEAHHAPSLQDLAAHTRAQAAAQGMEAVFGGGALFAADAKIRAERESLWMSLCGLGLTALLLWFVVRNRRAVWLLLPIAAGMVCGLAAVLLLFGQIHILTIVIGTGLIGVLVDFPLHWLAPALFGKGAWSPQQGMRRVLPTFAVSLAVTAGGYALLWFTPLPVLQQTAVFSTAALCGAFAATVCFLPPLFQGFQTVTTLPARAALRCANAPRLRRSTLYALAAVWLLCALGTVRSQWQDDIRNWVNTPPQLLNDARRIAQISGTGSSGQFIVVRGNSQDQLLHHNSLLVQQLGKYIPPNQIQSLHTLLLPTDQQRALKQQLHRLAEQNPVYAPLIAIGAPETAVRQALQHAAYQPDITLAQALQQLTAQAWQHLYLGKIGQQEASLVYLPETTPAQQNALQTFFATPSPHWQLIDTRRDLNHRFADTRNRAAWLKLLSFAAAWLLLWRIFGIKRGSLILAIPLTAALAVLGLLGWFGIPVGIFAMFGLLLTAAVGLDYAAYAIHAPETAAARLGGISLAAATTGISFALLAAASTPAVAAFGLTVAAGCFANWLLAVLLVRYRTP